MILCAGGLSGSARIAPESGAGVSDMDLLEETFKSLLLILWGTFEILECETIWLGAVSCHCVIL